MGGGAHRVQRVLPPELGSCDSARTVPLLRRAVCVRLHQVLVIAACVVPLRRWCGGGPCVLLQGARAAAAAGVLPDARSPEAAAVALPSAALRGGRCVCALPRAGSLLERRHPRHHAGQLWRSGSAAGALLEPSPARGWSRVLA